MNSLQKDEIISFLKSNKMKLKEDFGIEKIALFGSYARDEATDTSDIDLLIEMDTVSFRNRMALKRFLERHFKKKVDISYFDSVRTFIWRSIQEDLVYA